MSKKSFFCGVVTGVVITIVALFVLVLVKQNSAIKDNVKYFDNPVSYENKSETYFKVFQVLDNCALANELSEKDLDLYMGNTVVILGENYYSNQIITIKNPKRIGTYSYTNNGGVPMTVPIIDGDINN